MKGGQKAVKKGVTNYLNGLDGNSLQVVFKNIQTGEISNSFKGGFRNL